MKRVRTALFVIGALAATAVRALSAAAAESTSGWLTGAAFEKQLDAEVGVFWQDVPLREAVRGLGESQRVAILLDRRVDPDRKIRLKTEGTPLRDVLDQLAVEQGIAVTLLGPVVYLGPPESAAKLRTLALMRREDASRLPREAARRFSQTQRLSWPDFGEPRRIFSELAEANQLRMVDTERVPHDLWATADLPPLSLTDRLTLVALQFDLTFEISADGRAVRLTSLPEVVHIAREYPGGSDPRVQAAKWAKALPQCEIRVEDGKILVRGAVEDHDQIVASRRSPSTSGGPAAARVRRPAGSTLARTTFTVKETRGQLGALLRDLARQRGLQLQLDEQALAEAGISLQQPITFSVTDGTEDDLFEAICSPAGCTFRRQGNVIEVRPAR